MALVTLASYVDVIDAELAKERLASVGIEAVIADQHLASIQWLYSGAIGGVKVQIEADDLQRARDVLREDRSADLSGIPEMRSFPTKEDLCPACGSNQLRMSQLQRRAAAFSLVTGFPFIAWRRRWVCGNCGHSWKRRRPQRVTAAPETLAAEQQVYRRDHYPLLTALVLVLLGLGLLYYVQLQIQSPGHAAPW